MSGVAVLPTADAAGAVTGVAIIAVLLAALVGFVALAIRRGKRGRAEAEAGQVATADAPAADGRELEPNVGALGLAIAAAVLAVVSTFLPALESSSFSHIEQNTLIQSGAGYLIIGCAIGIAGASYRAHNERQATWAVLILGAVILGAAIYSGTGSRTELHSVLAVGGQSINVSGSPAVGLYAAGAAGVMAMFAGWTLAGQGGSTFGVGEGGAKICPDCAETVLDAARICKHCGHEFAPEASTDSTGRV
jgi:hypothetical protein